jgi:hypothetical protein
MTSQSLWLQPEPAAAAHLGHVIQTLAEEHGSPQFLAHVTVTGGIERDSDLVTQGVGALRNRLPIQATFTQLDLEDVVVRALYLRPARSQELHELHAAVASALELQPEKYDPHLSLMYTDLPRATRQDIARQLRLPLPMTVVFDTLSLWETPEGRFAEWRQICRWQR